MRLKIKNVGPIKNIDIELTKVNVIIGPQSSGKSTISKIACFLQWVEKQMCLEQSFIPFERGGVFIAQLIQFHNLEGYFDDKSYIEYVSHTLSIKLDMSKGVEPKIKWLDKTSYKRSKVLYIPSERNIISSINNWLEVRLEDNNTKSFLADWDLARKAIGQSSEFHITSLGVSYYFDKDKGLDFIKFKNNDGLQKEIRLNNASSGIQSAIPIYLLLNYYLETINEGTEVRSISENNRENILKEQLFKSFAKDNVKKILTLSKKEFDNEMVMFEESLKLLLNLTQKSINKKEDLVHDEDFTRGYDRVFKSSIMQQNFLTVRNIYNFLKNNHLDLFIEEPESHLFPSTQKELLYFLIEKTLEIDDSSLMLTTHSPFILYALNNCMMGGMISKNIEQEVTAKFESYKAWIDPNKVSVWEIHNGELKDIKDKKLNVIGQHYFNDAMGDTLGEYSRMLKYFKR